MEKEFIEWFETNEKRFAHITFPRLATGGDFEKLNLI